MYVDENITTVRIQMTFILKYLEKNKIEISQALLYTVLLCVEGHKNTLVSKIGELQIQSSVCDTSHICGCWATFSQYFLFNYI